MHLDPIMPLYFIPVSVSLRVARTLLKRLLSKIEILTHNLHMLLDTQEPKVFYKVKDFLKLTVVMWPHIVEKVAVFGLGLL